MECAFCDNADVQERLIKGDDFAFIFPTNTPIVPGHLLIIPKRHVQYYEDLTSEEKESIERLREWAKSALKRVFNTQIPRGSAPRVPQPKV